MRPVEAEGQNEAMNDIGMQQDIEEILKLNQRNPALALLRNRWVLAGLAALLVLALALFLRGRSTSDASEFVTRSAARGDLTVTITATGTIEPLNEVSVGIEVSGTVAEVLADYNDEVVAGDVLARLDTSILSANAAQARAALELARATRLEADAALRQAKSELARLEHLKELSGGSVPSALELDTAVTARDRAVATLASANAQIRQAEATLVVNQTQLEKAVVISPINGVVLSREIDPGQTVAASLQTPELFVIAEDLSEMELAIEIDEADVGAVREGQSASFTVDAFPDEEFAARITQLRYAPISSDGVVTYEAILSVDNADLRLRPGMTATAIVTVKQIEDALLIPVQALRFSPRIIEASSGGGILDALVPGPPRGDQNAGAQAASGKDRTIWALDANGDPTPVDIRIGSSDGSWTEVLGGPLDASSEVIIEQLDAS